MKSLKEFSKNLIEDMISRLHHYEVDRDEETLHQIRVDVKKMKAIIGLINYSRKQFRGHHSFIPFRNIFRKAGAIREPEVFQKLLNGKSIKKKQATDDSPAVDAFLDDVPAFHQAIKKEWKKLRPYVAEVNRKDFKEFFRKKLAEIEGQLSPKPNMKEIHRTRKSIKTVLYLAKVKGNLAPKDKAFFVEMEETIGQLHDKQALLANLKNEQADGNELKIKKLKAGCEADERKINKWASKYYG
jgi:CHAD domain-containing protein